MKIIGFYHMNEQTRLRFDCLDENNVGNLTQKNEALQPKTSRISHPSGHLRDSFSGLLRKHRWEIPITDSLVIPIQPHFLPSQWINSRKSD